MNVKPIFWILAFVLVFSIVGCQKQDAEPVADAEVSEPLPNERRGGLDATNELALGTLQLEGSTDAVTAEQAAGLLPLWRTIESGSLKSVAETEAVLKQIQGKMSETQLATIEAMALTMEDMQAWMQEQGIEMPERAAPGGQGGPGGQSGPGALGDLSEDERAQMREQFQSMSAEERATRMAEMGVQRPEGGPDNAAPPEMAGGGFSNLMLAPLIDLLAERAAQ